MRTPVTIQQQCYLHIASQQHVRLVMACMLITDSLCECRASDDIEGDLGNQLDSCVQSALSQCWGAPAIQSVTHKAHQPPSFAQSRHQAVHESSQHAHDQFGDAMQQSGHQSKLPQSSRLQREADSRGRPYAAVGSVFDSLDSIEQEEEVLKSWASESVSLAASKPVEHRKCDLDAKQYNRIRSGLQEHCCSG